VGVLVLGGGVSSSPQAENPINKAGTIAQASVLLFNFLKFINCYLKS
jgi:hypothetical protein